MWIILYVNSFVLQSGLFILFSVVYFVIETVNLYNDHRSFFNFNMFYEYIVCSAKLYFLPYPPPILVCFFYVSKFWLLFYTPCSGSRKL